MITRMPKVILLFLVVPIAFLVSCEQVQQGTDSEDSTNPYFRRAATYVSEENFYAAIQEYEQALQVNSSVVKAHVEMGVLYNEKLGDPISAIYHYQKYLNARPNAPDREKVQSYIDKAKIDFAITLPNSPAQNAEEAARINRENVELKQALADAQSTLSKKEDEIAQLRSSIGQQAAAVSDASNTDTITLLEPIRGSESDSVEVIAVSEMNTVPSAPIVSGGRVHTIQKGDSLWQIARQFYPNDVAGGVKKITEANPDKASNPQNLKLGDTLIIP